MGSEPRVYNKHHRNAPDGAVYIGRPSKWGNPFALSPTTSRELAIKRFEHYVSHSPETLMSIRDELRGKDLVCFCAPLPCHGDVLLRIANEEDNVRG